MTVKAESSTRVRSTFNCKSLSAAGTSPPDTVCTHGDTNELDVLISLTLLEDGERAGWALSVEDGGKVEDLDVRRAGVLDFGGDGQVGDGRDVHVVGSDGNDEARVPLERGGESTSNKGESGKREEHVDVSDQVREPEDLRL